MSALLPGAVHPHRPQPPSVIARQYGLAIGELQAWIAEGLPTARGLIDPFACVNWLSVHKLALVPALQRRWQGFLKWFEPFVQGVDVPRRIAWERRHRLYLPQAVAHLRWAVPAVLDDGQAQFVLEEEPLRSLADRRASGLVTLVGWRRQGAVWRLDQDQAPRDLSIRQHLRIARHPLRVLEAGSSEWRALHEVLVPYISRFDYGYRQHLIDDSIAAARARYPAGSCIDCALGAQGLLTDAGWETRLCGGIMAHSAIANPHFWVEARCRSGWVPIDPSMAAIARMLQVDWRPWLAAYIGGLDARRILIARGVGVFNGLRPCQYVSAATGAVVAAAGDGIWREAWACIDWVCGECSDAFASETLVGDTIDL